MACTVYFAFSDVGTWEPFAENLSDDFYTRRNTEAEGRGPASCLSKASCAISPFITTDKCVNERGEKGSCGRDKFILSLKEWTSKIYTNKSVRGGPLG